MGIATEMKALTRGIASSHRERTKGIGEIKKDVKGARREAHDTVHRFEDSRRESNRQLMDDLGRDKARRKSETTAMLKNARNILTDFKASRKEASARLRKDLSRGTAARQAEVKKTSEGTRKLIKGFHTSRQTVSHELKEGLGKSRVKAKSEVGKLLGDAQSLVRDFRTSRREAGGQLRKDLAQSKSSRKTDVRQMQGAFQKAQVKVNADLKEARTAWRGLAGTIQTRTGRKVTPLEAAAPAPKDENNDLEIKMLTAVREHPEGINLAGIAGSLGVASVVLGRVSTSLMKKGMIRKVEKIYFPADGEGNPKEGLHFMPPIR